MEDAPAVGLDPLVYLPPDMLDNVLARLPFEQLVRTSGLSRGWRRRWESVAGLDIWFSPGVSPKPSIGALKRCAAPVLSFTARVLPPHFHCADGWLRALRGKRVAKLAVELFDPRARFLGDVDGASLPAIFLHRELVHLDLAGCCSIPQVPRGFGGFPNLVTLSLNHVRLPFFGGGAHLQYLISSAPNLAELSLIDVDQEERRSQVVRCDIRAPKLRVLKLVMLNDNDNGCEVAEDLPMLEEAVISADCLLETDEFVTTFQRIATVNKLTFRTDSRKCNQDPLRVISWKFQNLKVATLSANFGKLSSIMSIFSLLRCAPYIEKLEIEVEKTYIQADEDDENFDPETYDDEVYDFLSHLDMVVDEIDEQLLNEKASDDLFVSLKHVSLHGIKGYMRNDICFMKFLLSKTGSLESFDVTLRSEFRKETACVELATCSRASPQAKISVRLLNKPTPEPDES